MDSYKEIENATESAIYEFWASIARSFPEIKGGEFPFDLALEQELDSQKMVSYWLEYNTEKKGDK